MSKFITFEERYNYLKLKGKVGAVTFGRDRYLNQILYKSTRWKKIRDKVITRDLGCDLGIEGYDIHTKILIHHMNPITVEDVQQNKDIVYDPEFLIVTNIFTHNAIHYCNDNLIPKITLDRKPGDTTPWR